MRGIKILALLKVHEHERHSLRSSDTSEATRARLDGITLDVARPAASASPLRPAIGVEQCDCPPQYNATSCQDPGRGLVNRSLCSKWMVKKKYHSGF